MIDDAEIVLTEIEALNFEIDFIDSVVPFLYDLVDVVVATDSFNTFAAFVQTADIEATLCSKDPFAVPAPTDDAIAKLPEITVEAFKVDTDAVADILLLLMIEGKIMAANASNGLEVETSQGSSVSFVIHGARTPVINEALIMAIDVRTTNGVIHMVDSAILPPA